MHLWLFKNFPLNLFAVPDVVNKGNPKWIVKQYIMASFVNKVNKI